MRRTVMLLALFLALVSCARAEERLAKLFTDNMVLQRDLKIPVWGWADAGTKVTIKIKDQEATATADEKGLWKAELKPMEAGGPFEMTVAGKNTVTLKNILVGDVWICSGQSNMEWGMWGTKNSKEEIDAAKFPQIRLFTVQKAISPTPKDDCNAAAWAECSPESVGGFSAVGFFFGRHLNQNVKVPIGLIHTSWGGTPAEAWTSKEALAKLPDYQGAMEALDKSADNLPALMKEYEGKLDEWRKAVEAADPGTKNPDKAWFKPETDTAAWKAIDLPNHWEKAGLPDFDGVVWFRKEVDVPAEWAGKELELNLGPIDDADITWFNGAKVGSMDVWNAVRKYKVPGELVKAGKNMLAVRVLDTGGPGGIYGKPEQLSLVLPGTADAKPVSLAGAWTFTPGMNLKDIPARPAPPPAINNQNAPTALYNAMISPLLPYAIKGAIWYQGESNAGRAFQYRSLFPAMITDWRTRWGQGNFPFFFVQLANFMGAKPEPGESAWAELREAQRMTLSLPNSGMAVIIDIGEAGDIHPKNKQDVGLRLALAARGVAYGEKIEFSGPSYKEMKIEDGKIRLTFEHLGTGLEAKGGGPLKSFAIAGEDKIFVWADAKIDGETVVVSSEKVAKPVAVRYAWADNPEGCNLYNKEGLPASPFRTDTWPGVTDKNK